MQAVNSNLFNKGFTLNLYAHTLLFLISPNLKHSYYNGRLDN